MANVPVAANLDPVLLDALYAQQLADELDLEEHFALAHQQQLLAAQAQVQPPPPPVITEVPKTPGIDDIVENMLSSSIEEKFKATEWAIKILVEAKDPPVRAQEMIGAGIYTIACSFINSKDTDLAVEAANLLLSILMTKLFIELEVIHSAIPPLLHLLQSPLNFVVKKGVRVFAEIAGISRELRHTLLKEFKILVPLLPLVKVKTTENLDLTRTIAWLTRQLSRTEGENQAAFTTTTLECLPMLERLIMVDDPIVICYACWSLTTLFQISSVCANQNGSDAFSHREALIKTGLIPRVIDLLGSNDCNIIEPCLLLLRDVVSGTQSQFEFMVRAKFLPNLVKTLRFALQRRALPLLRIALSSLVDICSGIDMYRQMRVDLLVAEMIVPVLLDIFKIDEAELNQSAIGILVIVLGESKQEQLFDDAIKPEFIDAISFMLFQNDFTFVEKTLLSLEYLLKKSAAKLPIQCQIIEALKNRKADERIRALQTTGPHNSMKVAKTVSENYFTVHPGKLPEIN